jgi:hypothetical protein
VIRTVNVCSDTANDLLADFAVSDSLGIVLRSAVRSMVGSVLHSVAGSEVTVL